MGWILPRILSKYLEERKRILEIVIRANIEYIKVEYISGTSKRKNEIQRLKIDKRH
jgi:hypothetical protein